MQIVVREAVKADAAGMGALYVRSWRETFPALVSGDVLLAMCPSRAAALWSRAIMSPNLRSRSIVAEAGSGCIAGLVSFGANRDADLPYDGEIFSLYVDVDYEGQGIGRALMVEAGRALLERGMRSCLSWVMTFSHTRFFCEALGGRAVGRKSGRVGGMPVSLSAYGWDDLRASLALWEADCAIADSVTAGRDGDGLSDAA